MAWRIEYTNKPWLKKSRRKILERQAAKAIRRIEGLLPRREDDGFMLDNEFSVESTWVEEAQKHHIAVRDLKSGESWVASVVFEGHPTMGVEEVKSHLRSLGLGENSLYGLGMTNEKTVGEYLAEAEENLNKADREEWLKTFDLATAAFLEGFLEKGIIGLSDGLLNALIKIHRHTVEAVTEA